MQKIAVMGTILLALGGLFSTLSGGDDIIGIVKSRPDGNTGAWKIDDHSIEVGEAAEFDTRYGPIEVGSCVKVSYDDDFVEAIESRPESRCR